MTTRSLLHPNSKPRRLHAMICLLAPIFVSLLLSSARGQVPRGVFSLKGAHGSALPGAYENPDVTGLSIRDRWSQLQESDGPLNFEYLDGEVQKATDHNKIAYLRIDTQQDKPPWVTQAVQDAGGTFFTFDDGETQTTIPVFWDPTYLAKKKAMIAALGEHFADNPTVKVVWVSFANATSEDWNVPHETDEVASWLEAGYTTEKLVDAGQQLIDATMTAFPNQYVALAIGGNGHSEDRQNLDVSATEVAAATISLTESKWPGRLLVQINSLSTFNPSPPGEDDSAWNVLWNSRPDVGAQMLDDVFANSCRVDPDGCGSKTPDQILMESIDSAVGYSANYVEVYEVDVRTYPGAITYARQQLEATPTPTRLPRLRRCPLISTAQRISAAMSRIPLA